MELTLLKQILADISHSVISSLVNNLSNKNADIELTWNSHSILQFEMVNEELQIAMHPDCKNDDFKVDFSRIDHDYSIVRAISQ